MKFIPGYDDRYQINESGEVYSVKEKRFLNGYTRNGYKHYRLWCPGEKKSIHWKAHRLVMLSFVGKSDLFVNHKDGDKLNNHVSNLEYCTHLENMEHCWHTLKKGANPNGRNVLAKLSDEQVLTILTMPHVSQGEFAKLYGVDQAVISKTRSGKKYKDIYRKVFGETHGS